MTSPIAASFHRRFRRDHGRVATCSAALRVSCHSSLSNVLWVKRCVSPLAISALPGLTKLQSYIAVHSCFFRTFKLGHMCRRSTQMQLFGRPDNCARQRVCYASGCARRANKICTSSFPLTRSSSPSPQPPYPSPQHAQSFQCQWVSLPPVCQLPTSFWHPLKTLEADAPNLGWTRPRCSVLPLPLNRSAEDHSTDDCPGVS